MEQCERFRILDSVSGEHCRLLGQIKFPAVAFKFVQQLGRKLAANSVALVFGHECGVTDSE